MVRIIENRIYGYDGKQYVEAAGLSTDSKPTGMLITGSLFLEADTGDVYVYDETGESWNKIGG